MNIPENFIFNILAIYVAVMILFYLISEQFIFFPPKASYKDSEQVIKIKTKSGKKISAYFFKNPKSKYTLLYSHGNAADIGQMRPIFELFFKQGYSIFSYDYQGYGTSEGRPSEKNTYEDIRAAFDYLTIDAGIPENNIILFGSSVGCGPTIDLAIEKPKVAALILESPFLSVFRVLTRIPLFPVDRYNNIKKVKEVKMPVLVIHGTEDTVIPTWHGERIFKAIPTQKQAYWVEGADHNDILYVAREQYWQALDKFVSTLNSSD